MVIVIILLFLTGIGYGGYKFIRYEKDQNERINSLQEKIDLLAAKFNSNRDSVVKDVFSDDAYNWLAIGNSITLHGIADYWWVSDRGMAATSAEKDYVHIVKDYLERTKGKVNSYIFTYVIWEGQSNDRAETLCFLEPYLDKRLDLITIQLGENASNIDTFREDFSELIKYIRQRVPNAQIIIVDDFWENNERSEIKKSVAQEFGLSLADLSDIQGDQSYFCGMGTVIYSEDGQEHVVDHEGVAQHPGDRGMKYIADRIIDLIY